MKKLGIVALAGALVAAAAVAVVAAPGSGLKPGEQVSPFHPKHLAGPLAGTSECFPCTFQNRPQVQVWVNTDKPENVAAITKVLSGAMKTYKANEFKALVVFLTSPKSAASIEKSVNAAARKPELSGVGMAVLDRSDEAVRAYEINTAADIKNTVLVYKDWKVAQTFVNLNADAAGLQKLQGAIARIAR